MERAAAKLLVEGKVYRPAYRYKRTNTPQIVRQKRRMLQGSDRDNSTAIRSPRISFDTDTDSTPSSPVVEEAVFSPNEVSCSTLSFILGRGSPPFSSDEFREGSVFMDDDFMEDDVFLLDASEAETSVDEGCEESWQYILDTLCYGTEESVHKILVSLRA